MFLNINFEVIICVETVWDSAIKVLTSATCGSAITKQGIYLNIYGLLYMGLFSLLIQIMSSLAIYFNLVSSLVEVNWFASSDHWHQIIAWGRAPGDPAWDVFILNIDQWLCIRSSTRHRKNNNEAKSQILTILLSW